jgi:hypothetical protein
VQPAVSYFGGTDPVMVYAKTRAQPGGFRDLSGDGTILKAGVTTPDGDIWRVRYTAGTNAILQNTNLTNFPDTYNAASPSPSLDGSKIVFSYKAPGQAWRVGEINSDGTGFRDTEVKISVQVNTDKTLLKWFVLA